MCRGSPFQSFGTTTEEKLITNHAAGLEVTSLISVNKKSSNNPTGRF